MPLHTVTFGTHRLELFRVSGPRRLAILPRVQGAALTRMISKIRRETGLEL